MVKRCIFCRKVKDWNSDLTIFMESKFSNHFPVGTGTICPKCRKEHTIDKFYKKMIDNLAQKQKKQLLEIYDEAGRVTKKTFEEINHHLKKYREEEMKNRMIY